MNVQKHSVFKLEIMKTQLFIFFCFLFLISFQTGFSLNSAEEVSSLSIDNPFELSIDVSGVVTDVDGTPLIGVNVLVKGTSKGTSTDFDGRYDISGIEEDDVLVFSYVGYQTQEINVEGRTQVDVVLTSDSELLEEIVVTALGVERKAKSLTYSTQVLKGEDLTVVKDANMINSLVGKISGMQINRSSSGVGGSVNITLRGMKSLRNNQPLYVVDGLPIVNTGGSGTSGPFGGQGTDMGDILSTINPEDIISINVLKGASASALYGSEGANGAVMITTKKGSAGATRIDVSSSILFDQTFYLPELQYSYGQSASEKGDAEESWGEKGDYSKLKNQIEGFFNTGMTFINSASLSGGTEKNQSYFSYANTTNKGVMPTNTFNQHSFNFRNSTAFFEDKLHFDGNLMYSIQNVHNRPTTGLYFSPLSGLYMFPRGLDLDSYLNDFEYLSPSRNLYLQNWFNINYDEGLGGTHHEQNPNWVLNRNPTDQNRHNIIGSVKLQLSLTEWLSLSARGTINKMWNNWERRVYAGTQGVLSGQTSSALPVDNGRYYRNENSSSDLYGDILLLGDKEFGPDLALNFTLGASITDYEYSGWLLQARKLLAPNAFVLDGVFRGEANSMEEWGDSFGRSQKQGVFGSANIGFREIVYLDLTARNDWSSTLANTPSEKSGYFYYSSGLSLIISELLQFPEWNDLSKLRFTYAEVGNDIAQYASVQPQASLTTGGVIEVNNSGIFGDDPLKPELSQSIELGYEGRFFDQRLSLDVALYKSNTKNQYVSFAGPRGLLNTTLYLNAGNVENKGLEVALGVDVIRTMKFNWRTGFNYTANRNKVLELHPKLGNTYSVGGNYNVLRVGGSFGDLWGKTFLRDNGTIVVSQDGTPLTDKDGYIGSVNPKAIVGWGNTLSFGHFMLGLNVDGRFGGQVISTTQGYLDSFGYSKRSGDARDAGGVNVNVVTEEGVVLDQVPAQNWYQGIGNRDGIIEGQVFDATNFRLRELSLSYRVPVNSAVIKFANIGLVGKNLFFFVNKAPFDPELSSTTAIGGAGYDNFGIPSIRSYGLDLKLTF